MNLEEFIHIIALGDSFTQGYLENGTKFHPYTTKLQNLLDQRGKYHVHNESRIGFTTEEMLLKLEELLEDEGEGYKIVIVQGGFAELKRPEKIIHNLMLIHQEAINRGARSLALTIPAHYQEKDHEWLRNARGKVNEELRSFCRKAGIPLLDIDYLLPHLLEDRDNVWGDGIHLTAKGSDKMGELIYDALTELL